MFDGDFVYNYWWRYFDEPLRNADRISWIQLSREADAALYECFPDLPPRSGDAADPLPETANLLTASQARRPRAARPVRVPDR